MTSRTRLVCVGACAIDTILTVPHFPEEDSKLRATAFAKRRGGNTANTLEVLQQLISDEAANDSSRERSKRASPELYLIATLPDQDCAQVAFIASSFDQQYDQKVDLSHCIYRPGLTEPVSSYIISSKSTSSRTIINNNALPEMTFDEFVQTTAELLESLKTGATQQIDQIWFHFEGRIPQTSLECIRYLRSHAIFSSKGRVDSSNVNLTISVELEKPGREGLRDLAHEADVVFYSKAWARGEGYSSAEDCLTQESKLLSANESEQDAIGKTLICTWGEHGASAVVLPPRSSIESTAEVLQRAEDEIIHSPAFISPNEAIVDSTGAGDTFIAGVLFGFICRRSNQRGSTADPGAWTLKQTLSFANGLAGRKILQEGFSGLGDVGRALQIEERQSQR